MLTFSLRGFSAYQGLLLVYEFEWLFYYLPSSRLSSWVGTWIDINFNHNFNDRSRNVLIFDQFSNGPDFKWFIKRVMMPTSSVHNSASLSSCMPIRPTQTSPHMKRDANCSTFKKSRFQTPTVLFKWQKVSFQTVKFRDLYKCRMRSHFRLPIVDEKAPSEADFDTILDVLKVEGPDTACVFNCQVKTEKMVFLVTNR